MSEKSIEQSDIAEYQKAANDLMGLGQLAVAFARVERAPRLPDGRRESDVEHSFHLALSAAELANQFYPELEVGLVGLFSIIHDLPEVYTGDVWTFNISDEARATKEKAEVEATGRLLRTLPPFWAELLRRYEEQMEPEARFVRLVDKITPAIVNFLDDPSSSTFLEDHNVASYDQLVQHRAVSAARLRATYPEFDSIHIIKEIVSEHSARHYFPESA